MTECSDCLPAALAYRIPTLSNFKKWKAAQFMYFFFLLAPVVLRNRFLKYEYYDHMIILIQSISLLNSSMYIFFMSVYPNNWTASIPRDSLKETEKRLEKFCSDGLNLYGITFSKMNVHLLLHLVHKVKQFGPLWTSWCFPFENMLGYFSRLHFSPAKPLIDISTRFVHGTKQPSHAIVRGSHVLQARAALEPKCFWEDSTREETITIGEWNVKFIGKKETESGSCKSVHNLPL